MHLITLVLLLALRVDSFMATDTSIDDGSCNDSTDTSPLEQARSLHPPMPQATKYAGKSALVLFHHIMNSCVNEVYRGDVDTSFELILSSFDCGGGY